MVYFVYLDKADIVTINSSPASSAEVDEYAYITIICNADGNPPPTISLYVDNQQIAQNTSGSLYKRVQITRRYNRKTWHCTANSTDYSVIFSSSIYFNVKCKYANFIQYFY
jgi:hypothetical protein